LYILASSSEFQEKSSGWAIKKFNSFEITIIKLKNIPVSGYILAPKNISARNAQINCGDHVFCHLASLKTPQNRFLSKNLSGHTP